MSLIDLLFSAWYLQIPVVIGGVLHMLVVTHNWLPTLKKPIQQRLFGANKTWRGMLLVPDPDHVEPGSEAAEFTDSPPDDFDWDNIKLAD